eukprot:4568444-Alexandrium_andersonii.AAC.1
MARLGLASPRLALARRRGAVPGLGAAWRGLVWLGLARPGLAWAGLAWPPLARPGPASGPGLTEEPVCRTRGRVYSPTRFLSRLLSVGSLLL